jgi:hypothetical protein
MVGWTGRLSFGASLRLAGGSDFWKKIQNFISLSGRIGYDAASTLA